MSMKIKELSDSQIYALYQNKHLSLDVKGQIIQEFKRRNFSLEEHKSLKEEYYHLTYSYSNLTFLKKVLIILLAPFFIFTLFPLLDWVLFKGHFNRWKPFWKFTMLGYILWFTFILLFSKYYIFQK